MVTIRHEHCEAVMRRICGLLAGLMVVTALSAAEPIVPPDAKLEKLFDGYGMTEGVTSAPDGAIYFSDITSSHLTAGSRGERAAGHIWRFDPKNGQTTVFRSPSNMSNGIKFDAAGNMTVCEGADHGGRRVIRTEMRTGLSRILADSFGGRAFNSPNDLTIDARGRIYFTDPRYVGGESIEQPLMAVYRIDPDGSVQRIITDAGKPNGICVSPDQRSLYVVCNDNGTTAVVEPNRDRSPPSLAKGRMAILAYDLAADGSAVFRKTLVNYAPQDGPDGLVCDVDGNLYVAERAKSRPGIGVYSPEGQELGHISTEAPTNVGFGRGSDANLLYITAGKSLYRVRLNGRGFHLPE